MAASLPTILRPYHEYKCQGKESEANGNDASVQILNCKQGWLLGAQLLEYIALRAIALYCAVLRCYFSVITLILLFICSLPVLWLFYIILVSVLHWISVFFLNWIKNVPCIGSSLSPHLHRIGPVTVTHLKLFYMDSVFRDKNELNNYHP